MGTADASVDGLGCIVHAIDLRAESRRSMPRIVAHPHLLEAAMGTWHARMINEYASSRVFDALASQLELGGFDEMHGRQARQFAEEERHHGVLCGAVVEALGGEAKGELFEVPEFPEHVDAPPRARVLRNVVSICAMSETVAVALIGAERLEMPEGELRELLTRIWSDEIGHARFGWRLLEQIAPSLTQAERDAVRAYIPVALRHLEAHELAHLPARDAPEGGECLGLCSGNDARVLLSETIAEVIVPRLSALFSWSTPVEDCS